MKIKVTKLVVDYNIKGNGETLLLLHGWSKGINKEKYSELINLLAKKYQVVSVDFPGFGQSDQPQTTWDVKSYANWLHDFLIQTKIKPKIIVGHSFGGRVAIKGISQGLLIPKKLILVASAGIERKSLKVKILKLISSFVPKIIKQNLNFGSKDLRESSGVMRESMKLIVGENLEKNISQITVPTLLIWGSQDYTTPLWQGKLMNNLIDNSQLKVINDANHGVPYREAKKISQLIIDWQK